MGMKFYFSQIYQTGEFIKRKRKKLSLTFPLQEHWAKSAFFDQ